MSHASAYRTTPGLKAPACTGQLRHVGMVHLPGNETGSLEQCSSCRGLVVFHLGRVVIDEPLPPAAMPAAAGAAAEPGES